MGSLGDLIETAAARLDRGGVVFGHGTDNAWDEAVALVLHVTNFDDDAEQLHLPVSELHAGEVQRLLDQRVSERIPLPYLLGKCRFAGLEFLIEPGVVIPRSPIAELIGRLYQPWLIKPPDTIVDICCGSGCIGIASALRFPDSRLTLIDIDPQALELARRNAAHHGIGERTTVVQADVTTGVPAGDFDLVVSNPPYVDAGDMHSLPPEYRHEPAAGLAGGADGLAVVASLLQEYPRRLGACGLFVGEVGASAAALSRRYPGLPFIWPALQAGGEGVFVLLPAS